MSDTEQLDIMDMDDAAFDAHLAELDAKLKDNEENDGEPAEFTELLKKKSAVSKQRAHAKKERDTRQKSSRDTLKAFDAEAQPKKHRARGHRYLGWMASRRGDGGGSAHSAHHCGLRRSAFADRTAWTPTYRGSSRSRGPATAATSGSGEQALGPPSSCRS
jgi:hypothetical protein